MTWAQQLAIVSMIELPAAACTNDGPTSIAVPTAGLRLVPLYRTAGNARMPDDRFIEMQALIVPVNEELDVIVLQGDTRVYPAIDPAARDISSDRDFDAHRTHILGRPSVSPSTCFVP